MCELAADPRIRLRLVWINARRRNSSGSCRLRQEWGEVVEWNGAYGLCLRRDMAGGRERSRLWIGNGVGGTSGGDRCIYMRMF